MAHGHCNMGILDFIHVNLSMLLYFFKENSLPKEQSVLPISTASSLSVSSSPNSLVALPQLAISDVATDCVFY